MLAETKNSACNAEYALSHECVTVHRETHIDVWTIGHNLILLSRPDSLELFYVNNIYAILLEFKIYPRLFTGMTYVYEYISKEPL